MKNILQTGATRQGRRTTIGVVVAVASLSAACSVAAQSLMSSGSNTLPALSDSQFGTAGTTTITQGAATADPSAISGLSDPTLDPADPNAIAGGATANTAASPPRQQNADGALDTTQPYEEDLNQTADQAIDPGTPPIGRPEWEEQRASTDDAPGIPLGTFRLRPTVSQSINTEVTHDSGYKETRNFLATGIRGTLSSDWSRHALTVTGDGVFQRNINGSQNDTEPHANIEADLRLDLADHTTGHVIGRYNFQREDVSDPNAIGDASEQAGVHEFGGEASIEREAGRIRGLAAIGASRQVYTAAKLDDGTVLSMKDRDRTGIDGRLRLGYELSPAIIPFAEISMGHTIYDRRRDDSGYERSSNSYAGRAGVAFDLGEKLNGELAAGYQHVAYEDPRLKAVDGLTLDGKANWSPHRGTDVSLGLRTIVQDSTTPGESGWAEYQLSSVLAHQMRDHLVARLTGSTTYRDFGNGGEDNVTWIAGTGLTWSISRYLELTGDVEYERTTGGGSDQGILRAGVGLAVKH